MKQIQFYFRDVFSMEFVSEGFNQDLNISAGLISLKLHTGAIHFVVDPYKLQQADSMNLRSLDSYLLREIIE